MIFLSSSCSNPVWLCQNIYCYLDA